MGEPFTVIVTVVEWVPAGALAGTNTVIQKITGDEPERDVDDPVIGTGARVSETPDVKPTWAMVSLSPGPKVPKGVTEIVLEGEDRKTERIPHIDPEAGPIATWMGSNSFFAQYLTMRRDAWPWENMHVESAESIGRRCVGGQDLVCNRCSPYQGRTNTLK